MAKLSFKIFDDFGCNPSGCLIAGTTIPDHFLPHKRHIFSKILLKSAPEDCEINKTTALFAQKYGTLSLKVPRFTSQTSEFFLFFAEKKSKKPVIRLFFHPFSPF